MHQHTVECCSVTYVGIHPNVCVIAQFHNKKTQTESKLKQPLNAICEILTALILLLLWRMQILVLQLHLPPTTSNTDSVTGAAIALNINADADTTVAAVGPANINASMKQYRQNHPPCLTHVRLTDIMLQAARPHRICVGRCT